MNPTKPVNSGYNIQGWYGDAKASAFFRYHSLFSVGYDVFIF